MNTRNLRGSLRAAAGTAALAVTALAATMLAAPAQAAQVAPAAQPPPAAPGLAPAAGPYDLGPAGDPLRTVAATYLTSHPDLTPAAAHAAAVAQASAGVALKAEILERWETFGGGWFDPYTATYHLTVTDPATGQALAGIGDARGVAVETPVVDRNLDELTATMRAIQAGTSPLGQATGDRVGIDVRTNQVLAAVPAGQVTSLARQAPAGVTVIPATEVAVEPDACTSRLNCDNFLAAGLLISNGDADDPLNPGGSHVCSLGFTARNAANQRITLTAGHCSTGIGQPWSNGNTTIRDIGTVSARTDSGPDDVTRIVSTNSFYGNVNNGQIYFAPPAATVRVTGESFLLVGDTACLSASFQAPTRVGNACGTVGSVADPSVRGMVRIDGYDSCPGDSGGGWYWHPGNEQRYAVALHSRSTPGCNEEPLRSYASPLSGFHPDLVYEIGS